MLRQNDSAVCVCDMYLKEGFFFRGFGSFPQRLLRYLDSRRTALLEFRKFHQVYERFTLVDSRRLDVVVFILYS